MVVGCREQLDSEMCWISQNLWILSNKQHTFVGNGWMHHPFPLLCYPTVMVGGCGGRKCTISSAELAVSRTFERSLKSDQTRLPVPWVRVFWGYKSLYPDPLMRSKRRWVPMTPFRGNKSMHSTRSLTSPIHHQGSSHIYMRICDILWPYPLVHHHIVTHHRIVTLVACFTLAHIDIQRSSWIPQASSTLYQAYFEFSMTLLCSELRPSEFASEFASEQPQNSLGMPRRHLHHIYKEHIDIHRRTINE